MSDFKLLDPKDEKKLSSSELINYYKELREYLKNSEYLNYSDAGIRNRERLNILIKKY